MVFNSYIFIFCFLPIFLLCWNIPVFNKTWRYGLILIASYIFYAWWDYRFIFLMIFVTLINFLCGYYIHTTKSHRLKKSFLIVAISSSLGFLFFFKYLPWLGSYASVFFNDEALNSYHSFLDNIILPVGISFFTFQAMSYTIDIFNNQCRYSSNIFKFSAYVSMFPQLVAGPIIRYRDIDEQLDNINDYKANVDYSKGIELFLRGLIKKVVFADRIGPLIESSFLPGAELNAGFCWIVIISYSLQIYFDFSGYSDMAIGIGRCIGFKFPDNFKAPYTALNPSEFWRRWHITLSTWLRDYLYIPLGGNKFGKTRTLINLVITMFLGGLWHGAAWTFILWGLWHGLLLVVHRVTPAAIKSMMPKWISLLLLNLAVIIGWIFFRSNDIGHAFVFLKTMFGGGMNPVVELPWILYLLIPAGYYFHYLERLDEEKKSKKGWAYVLILSIFSTLSILELGKDTPFIYFQF